MGFLANLNWRYATKKFNGQTVQPEKLEQILEAVRMAPSALGTQPYHVIIVSSKELKDRLYDSCGQVDKKDASHLLVFCTRTDYPARTEVLVQTAAEIQDKAIDELAPLANMINNSTGKKSPEELRVWAMRQTYIALGFAIAACAELEVDSCPMEGFSPDAFHKILELPDHIRPIGLLALGYRDPADHNQPALRAKVRFPKDDLFEFR